MKHSTVVFTGFCPQSWTNFVVATSIKEAAKEGIIYRNPSECKYDCESEFLEYRTSRRRITIVVEQI